MTDLAALLHPSVCFPRNDWLHPLCEQAAASLTERGLTVVPETALAVVAAAEEVIDASREGPKSRYYDAMASMYSAVDAHRAEAVRCGCTLDAELGAGSVCPKCHHRDHGASGCRATIRAAEAVQG